MKIEYYEDMLEQEAINKYLNMIANDYNGELAKIFEEKYINKDKEIERLQKLLDIEKNKREQFDKDNQRLHSIIKEVREYIMSELITEWDIKNNGHVSGSDLPVDAITPILKILDKGE